MKQKIFIYIFNKDYDDKTNFIPIKEEVEFYFENGLIAFDDEIAEKFNINKRLPEGLIEKIHMGHTKRVVLISKDENRDDEFIEACIEDLKNDIQEKENLKNKIQQDITLYKKSICSLLRTKDLSEIK